MARQAERVLLEGEFYKGSGLHRVRTLRDGGTLGGGGDTGEWFRLRGVKPAEADEILRLWLKPEELAALKIRFDSPPGVEV